MKDKKNKLNLPFYNESDNHSWALTYSDIITMLLCFFMLFYSFEKKKMNSTFSHVISLIKDDLGLSGLNKKDIVSLSQGKKAFLGDGGLYDELKDLTYNGEIKLQDNLQYINIEFTHGSLFDLGKSRLNRAGFEKIIPVIQKLIPYQNKILVNIISFTDPMPIKVKEQRWWRTNEELSALRALNVQKVFFNKGYRRDAVYISGKGVKKLEKDEALLQDYRTVTIRLESRMIK